MDKMHQQIAVLDFGSQYAHLIARRFRQLGVLAKLYPPDYEVAQIPGLIGLVLSGGPQSVNDQKIALNSKVFELNLPVLGLCYGHQLMAKHFGGQVQKGTTSEYGKAVAQIGQSVLFAGLEGGEVVWMSHADSVRELPEGFKTIASSEDCPISAMACEEKKLFGLQFHPEVTHTQKGLRILENFAFEICQATRDWQIEDWQKEMIEKIKQQAGSKKVFLLVSGGVDSTVAFALLEKALGQDRVFGLHVDTGLMRQAEAEQVKDSLASSGFKNLRVQDASDQFLGKLKGIFDPEEKRKIIGQLFLDIQEQVSRQLELNPDEWLLGQGTIYPDTIETGGTRHADTIKTHHNRVAGIQELIRQGRIIEPIRDLYKDEVRELGLALGLPEKLVWRQPFPGPGLGIRLLCHSLEAGVQGDFRTYAHPCLLEGFGATEADWLGIERISPQLTNQVREINRVLLNVGSKKYQGGKLMEASVTKERLELLREIDAIVQAEVFRAGLERDIWQFPVVLVPFGIDGKESVALRPVSSLEAMTARFYPLSEKVLTGIVGKIEGLGKISYIFFDATNKPPGTIEWE